MTQNTNPVPIPHDIIYQHNCNRTWCRISFRVSCNSICWIWIRP